jgi:disulfide bond formation protein DsbB
MYPIVLVSAVGLWKKTCDAVDYVLPFAIVGTIIEIYQLAQIYIPQIRGVCSWDVPCFIPKVNYFGRLTIPLLCLIAFVVILVIGLLLKRANRA